MSGPRIYSLQMGREAPPVSRFSDVKAPALRVRKPLDEPGIGVQFRGMDMDHDACYRVISQRDARFDGKLFIGVRTTGVYCRPICPARTPLSKNVTFFASAAAAQEGGFRPCLRCRPETAPDLGAWRGTSNTVSRGLALIELGALDDGDVQALADRLGLGERQLRRLFRQHLGASPVAVGQTRRVLLAKQLIAETRLPMAEVAFASGFGSIRRFNETFQALFDRPPMALRRLGGADVSAGPAGEISLRLSYRPPFDWDAMLAFLSARAIAGVERVDAGAYARTVQIGAETGTVRVRPTTGDALLATVRFPRLSALPVIIARIRRVFDLAADPGPIEAHLARDPRLAPLVAARPGLRAPGAWDGFELACRAVLGQQVSVAQAIRLASRLVADLGAPIAAPEEGLTRAFPAPEAVAEADLSTLPMPKSRSAALSAVAAALLADPNLLSAPATSTRQRRVCGRSRASVNGRRNTSPCGSCGCRTRSRPPTSA